MFAVMANYQLILNDIEYVAFIVYIYLYTVHVTYSILLYFIFTYYTTCIVVFGRQH